MGGRWFVKSPRQCPPIMRAGADRIKDQRSPQFAVQIGSPTARYRGRFAVRDPLRSGSPLGFANYGNKEVVMSHRLFAQLAFERALGNAAIDALNQALNDKEHFTADSMWPNLLDLSQAEVDAQAAELVQVIEDRIKDVLDGPGIRNIERGDRFYDPQVVSFILAAKAKRQQSG